MTVLTVTEVRSNLYRLIIEVVTNHIPLLIKGKKHNAILISEENWIAVQETLHLVSIPGMTESIIQGSKEPLSKYSQEISFWSGK